LADQLQTVCGGLLHLGQALVGTSWKHSPRLWVITRQSRPVDAVTGPIDPVQTSLWALGRTVALEHPEIWGGALDVDGASNIDAERVFEWLTAETPISAEEQIVIRGGQYFVPRLVRAEHLNEEGRPAMVVRPDATYLITGGLGALGVTAAKWLIERGARFLALLGRGLTHRASSELDEWRARGVRLEVIFADVADETAMMKAFQEIAQDLPPLKGVIHAAGTLDDGALVQQNWARFEAVIAPKVAGAWNLHHLTLGAPLDFFVLFSSMASLVGTRGQGNYAMANAFLDAFAHYRHTQGLPATSINWGPWGQGGMATSLLEGLAAQGLRPIQPEEGLLALESLVLGRSAQAGIVDCDWEQYATQFPESPGLLASLIRPREKGADVPGNLLQELKQSRPESRLALLLEVLRGVTEHVMGQRSFSIDRSLIASGLDSLMAIELRSWIKRELGEDIPLVRFLEGVSVAELAAVLNERLSANIGAVPEAKHQRGQIPTESTRVSRDDRVAGEL